MMEEKKRKLTEEMQVDPAGEALQKKSKKRKKKKFEEESRKPCLSYDMDELFSNGGRRAGGSHLNFTDIRTLIMLTVHGERFPCLPTWCRLTNWKNIRKTVVLMMSGVSSEDYKKYEDSFRHLNTFFATPGIPLQNEGNTHMLKSPLESFLFYRMPKKLQTQKHHQASNGREGKDVKHHCDFMLTENEMRNNEFPEWNSSAKEHGVVTTRKDDEEQQKAHSSSNLYAIDCEMCRTGSDRALTRVTVVNRQLQTLYDELVKPEQQITDYVTEYSGITADMLENVTTRLKDVQKALLKMIEPDSILVGHSLDFDLRALKLHHDNIIDTSVLYADQRGPRYKSSLKFLAKSYLNRDIQNSSAGHCSVEDALTCMELVNLKMEKGETFGDPTFEKESIYEALHRVQKKGALLDESTIIRQHALCDRGVHCSTDGEVVRESKKAIKKCDFTFARIKTFNDHLQECKRSNETNDKLQKMMLSKVDGYVGEVLTDVPDDCLVVVSLCSGYLPADVVELLKDKEERKTEKVKEAVRHARNGLCFVKIT